MSRRPARLRSMMRGEGMMRFSTYRVDLIRALLSYEAVLRENVIAGTPEMVVERLHELRAAAQLATVYRPRSTPQPAQS
jgi:hypothetical protein